MDEHPALAAYLIFARDLASEVKQDNVDLQAPKAPQTVQLQQTPSRIFRFYVERFRDRESKIVMNEFLREAAHALHSGAAIDTLYWKIWWVCRNSSCKARSSSSLDGARKSAGRPGE
jgi:hypothetical protein